MNPTMAERYQDGLHHALDEMEQMRAEIERLTAANAALTAAAYKLWCDAQNVIIYATAPAQFAAWLSESSQTDPARGGDDAAL